MSDDPPNLIDDVAAKIAAAFARLTDGRGAHEFVRTKALAEERERHAALAPERFDGESAEAYAARMAARERALAEAERFQAGEEARRAAFKEVGYDVTDQLARLTPDTYPRDEPETPRRMHAFLRAFSLAYGTNGKQRGAGAIAEYLLAADYDHTFWLWREWIAACLAVEDYEGAEALIRVVAPADAGDSESAPTAGHKFAKQGGRYKPSIMVAKAQIALRRDGDVRLAYEIANNARLAFGDAREAVGCYRALAYLKQEVDAGRLQLEAGRNGTHRVIDAVCPPTALLEGRWGGAEEATEAQEDRHVVKG